LSTFIKKIINIYDSFLPSERQNPSKGFLKIEQQCPSLSIAKAKEVGWGGGEMQKLV